MGKISLFIVVLILNYSCKNNSNESHKDSEVAVKNKFEKIEELSWLIGQWTNLGSDQKSYENWMALNDSTLACHSFTMVQSDTVFEERVTLSQKGADVYFVVAHGQNDNKAVTFKMIDTNERVYSFENLEHDFPTRIVYSNPEKDSIHAWIEGTIGNEPKKVDFFFSRKL